jgi:electron transfer flavoprotein alpha subunit
VYIIHDPLVRDYTNDAYVAALERLNSRIAPEIMLFGHTNLSMDLAPRLAFRLETAVTLDCIDLSIDPGTKRLLKTKPVYGGNAVAVYSGEGRPQMATVRAKVFDPPGRDDARSGEIIPFDPTLDRAAIRQRVIKRVKEEVSGVRLEEAGFIVCGGRGMGSAEAFELLVDLARLFNGAMGATRPPCDLGWVPSHLLIGLTGKLVTPDVYVGVALSGSSQHMAGMSGSKHIIAINKDPDANIYGIAQYGVVGDYKRVIPAFIEKCRELLAE